MSEFGGLSKHENNQHAVVPQKPKWRRNYKLSHKLPLLWRTAEKTNKVHLYNECQILQEKYETVNWACYISDIPWHLKSTRTETRQSEVGWDCPEHAGNAPSVAPSSWPRDWWRHVRSAFWRRQTALGNLLRTTDSRCILSWKGNQCCFIMVCNCVRFLYHVYLCAVKRHKSKHTRG